MLRIEHSIRVSALALCLLAAAGSAYAQSGTATLGGTVVDESDAVVADVTVTILARATGFQRENKTSPKGQFAFPALQPGKYTVRATRQGFTPVEVSDLTLNVDDNITIRLQLKVEKVGEVVTVVAEPARLSRSPAVGTVIDRQFVENLPLNGRSLHSLLELTPGVVLARAGNSNTEGGQFSVNGQRTNANYFTVDGVSANVGMNATQGTPGQSGSGQLPGLTALGTTNGLVSVDALQEFRIHTSTYAPEFGRMPGGQVSMVTRAGTNVFHGSAFEYFRDDALDANDWFVNRNRLAKPQLNQHNFGGVLGGPILRNRTFFFASYEGLRLDQPQARVVVVPSSHTRRIVAPAAQPYLNALPISNGRDLTGGFAEFAASWSDSSRLDATSVRFDHHSKATHTLFGRLNYAPSYTVARVASLSTTDAMHKDTMAVTGGWTWIISNRLTHDLRVNHTTTDAPVISLPDAFGGAEPPPTTVFAADRNANNTLFSSWVDFTSQWRWGIGGAFEQRQFNVVDTLTLVTASHEWKIGVDFRRLNPLLGTGLIAQELINFGVASLPLGRADLYSAVVFDSARRRITFDNLSLYAQDVWKPTSRLTLTYGLRWEFVPPPHGRRGENPFTLENFDDPYGGRVQLAPRDAPLWKTRYNNFAPRLGASLVVSDKPGSEFVVRGGIGIFHDTGLGQVANSFWSGYPFLMGKNVSAPTLPLTADVLHLPRPGRETPPQGFRLMDRNIRLPHIFQWNLSVERALGSRQTVTASYVGADGHDLLNVERFTGVRLLEFPESPQEIHINRNGGYSDYRALQLQFQRRLHRGLQSLASYTYGRSRDTGSTDWGALGPAGELLVPDIEYGHSDYDLRHVFTAGVTYQVPSVRESSLWRVVLRDWGIDVMLRARSAFPVRFQPLVTIRPGLSAVVRPDVVAGQPFWIDDPTAPGGRRLNRDAFIIPSGRQGNLQRGAVRGFNARQVDLALRRDLRLPRRARLQLRFELFNLFNTPNFADPTPSTLGPGFGFSTQMLNRGYGGLNALYQIGGPRSVQLAAKILF